MGVTPTHPVPHSYQPYLDISTYQERERDFRGLQEEQKESERDKERERYIPNLI